jgi:predicted transcriptional regulator
MAYRNRTEIAVQILESIYGHDGDENGEGVTQTKITYAVYLSSAQSREYLTALTIHGLLSYDSAMSSYHITERGIRLLKLYSKLRGIMKKGEEEQF